MNTLVSFFIAKLLKNKGFDIPTEYCYLPDGSMQFSSGDEGDYDKYDHNQWDNYSAPTISEVVMWLYEKHGIWIGVDLTDNTKEFYFQPTIWVTKERVYDDFEMLDQAKYICKWKEWEFNSPNEAYQTAIEYTLNNLIK